jgi:rare lipoprotein A
MGRLLPVRARASSTVRRAGLVRRAAGLVVTLAVVAGVPAVGAAPADDARERRFELLVQAAELTDQLEEAEAGVVSAQLRTGDAEDALAVARRRVQARAVTAYMRGLGARVDALGAPRAYLEVAAAKERDAVARLRSAARAAEADRRRAEAARGELRAASAALAAVQAQLDVQIAADDARRAEERRRANEARAAALARQAAADAEARRRALTAAFGGSPGGYAPSPLDPNALLPRHKAATERQLALMRRIPFGPLPAGGLLPAGLTPTGQRVEGGASWYGPGFNGRPTASGAIYDQEAWTVASRDLPLGTFLVVARGERRVLLLVNDRGPYVDGRVLDLSAAAARALGVGGVGAVTAEVVAAPVG